MHWHKRMATTLPQTDLGWDGPGRTDIPFFHPRPHTHPDPIEPFLHFQALYRPGLEGEELVKLACQCLRAGLERDCASGYGLVAYLVTREGVRRTVVQGRMD